MSKAPRAARLSPDARRQQLLGHAIEVFASKGLSVARHTDLAGAAGVSLPTTLHYFPSREVLVSLVLAEVSRFLLEDILAAQAKQHRPATEAIAAVLLGYVGYDMVHYSQHHVHFSRGSYLAGMKQYHMKHHYSGAQNRGFGITSTLWDRAFGTFLDVSKLAGDAAQRAAIDGGGDEKKE